MLNAAARCKDGEAIVANARFIFAPVTFELGATASGLFVAGRPRRFVWMRIFSVHPLRDEAVVLMPHQNLRSMTVLSVLFGQFYCSAQRLCFAWESCGHMAMSISDLPSAILVHHDVSRFEQRFLQR